MRVIYTARKHGIDDKDAIRAATQAFRCRTAANLTQVKESINPSL